MSLAMKQRALIILICLFSAGPALGQGAHWLAGEMQDAGPHPRAAVLPADRAALQERLGREPYLSLFRRLHQIASRDHDPFDHETGPTQLRANTARAAAFLFWLDRTLDADLNPAPFDTPDVRRAMGEKAVLYLQNMLTERRVSEFTVETHTPHEVQLWAETLDLLLGADVDVLGADRALVVQNVADLAADLFGAYSFDLWVMERTTGNNHLSKAAASMGTAAIVLNGESFDDPAGDGRYSPEAWIDFAVRNVDLVLRDWLSDPDSGYTEGGSYMSYAAISHLPFMWAWHRYTGGASYQADVIREVGPYYILGVDEPYSIADLWTHPWFEQNALWALKIMLPDGRFPPFDDCTPGSRFYFGALARPEFENAGLLLWAWQQTGNYTGGSVDQTILLLTALDDGIAPLDPDAAGWGRTQMLPYSGQVVFRSGWDTDSVYALVQCEHGKAMGWAQSRWGDRIDGVASHEHPDPGSVMLYAYGEPLLIDGGYLGYENHSKVSQPQNHNIPLVDGQGPMMPQLMIPEVTTDDQGNLIPVDMREEGGWAPGDDGKAYLVYADEEVPFAEIFFQYTVNTPPTTLRRRAIFLADRFLVLHDLMQTEGSDNHTYTVQLHGNGGGTSGGTFELLGDGALWTRGTTSLRAAITSTESLEFTQRDSIHDAGGWEELTHTALDANATAQAGRKVEFLATLLPQTDTDQVEILAEACPGPCIKWNAGETTCFAWTGFSHDVESLLQADGGAYCQEGDRLAGMFEIDTDGLLTASFQLDTSSWRAKVHFPGDSLDLPAIAGQNPRGVCSHADSGGRWSMQVPPGGEVTTGSDPSTIVAHLRLANVAVGMPRVISLGDEADLRADYTCSAAEEITYSFTLVRKPETSLAALPESPESEDQIRFIPDLPGVYGVEVQASAGGQTSTAALEFEVEGEGRLPPEEEPPPDDKNGGCSGCGTTSGPPPALLGAILALLATLRRRTRK
jgi:MYXO-CTERM domain-containing protein